MKYLDPDNEVSMFRFSLVGMAFMFFLLSYMTEVGCCKSR